MSFMLNYNIVYALAYYHTLLHLLTNSYFQIHGTKESEVVNRRRTDNAMAKSERKPQTMIYETHCQRVVS
jgi:hypothetical protein